MNLIRSVGHRRRSPDRSRALSRADVEQLPTRKDVSLRERTFCRLAYESAARSAELLALNVEDLDVPNRRARVVRKRLGRRHHPTDQNGIAPACRPRAVTESGCGTKRDRLPGLGPVRVRRGGAVHDPGHARDPMGVRSVGEDLQAWIWLPGVVFDSGKHPDGSDVVEVEHFVIEVETGAPALRRRQPPTGSGPSRPSPETAGLLDSLSKTASAIALSSSRGSVFGFGNTGSRPPARRSRSNPGCPTLTPGTPSPCGRVRLAGRSRSRCSPACRAADPRFAAPHYRPACPISSPERLLTMAGFPNGSFHRLSASSGPRTRTPPTAVFLAVTACETKVKMGLGMKLRQAGNRSCTTSITSARL